MKKYIFPVIAVILILICLITILPAPNPKRCAICDSIPMHAPALVNLATGEVGELAADGGQGCTKVVGDVRHGLFQFPVTG